MRFEVLQLRRPAAIGAQQPEAAPQRLQLQGRQVPTATHKTLRGGQGGVRAWRDSTLFEQRANGDIWRGAVGGDDGRART